jgi:hypothetical protein
VDGKETEVFSSSNFLSVKLWESGKHEITFVYEEPLAFTLSKYISLISFPLLLCPILVFNFKEKRMSASGVKNTRNFPEIRG